MWFLGILLQFAAPIADDPPPPWVDVARAQPESNVADDWVVEPPETIERCEDWLRAAGVEFRSSHIPVHDSPEGTHRCGAPQVVRYVRGPGGIRWSPAPKVTCGVALAMARFELLVQQEAEAELSGSVVKIEHMGTYNCREMANYPGWVSEHSYANGIDVRTFVLRGGREVSVLGHYGDGVTPAQRPETRFMRAVARRSYDEDVFATVLTPAFDRLHRNHLHLDMARYRVDGTRSSGPEDAPSGNPG